MQHGCACAAVLLALLVGQAASAAFVANPAEHLSHAKRELLERLYSAQLAVPEKLIRHGQKFDIDGARQWHRLLKKLETEGSTVNILVYGGSVSVGYRLSSTSYPEQLAVWLRVAFPGVEFRVKNLARRATAATFAALCLVQEQPPAETDLILIEYSANGYGGQCQCFTAPQTAGYETLLRKVITRSPQAALLAFATYLWEDGKGKRSKLYDTGEDQHAVVAKRYGVPMMSARDTFFDVFYDAQNPYHVNRTAILVDIVHVGDYGAKVYASLLAWAVRHQVTRLVLHSGHTHSHVHSTPPPLPPPINDDAAQESWPTFCAEGLGLKQYVLEQQGWDWVDEGSNACEGCHKYGYLSRTAGSFMILKVNSDLLGSSSGPQPKVILALSYLRTYADIGRVRVECIAGCSCKAIDMDGQNKVRTSEIHTERMEVSPHKECRVKITLLGESATSGRRFRLSSVAVHREDKVLQYAYAPVYD